jgi:restriction system protein
MENVTLPVRDGTTQIDQLVISTYGIFVIETKNMKGWIFGSPDQAQWTQQIYRHKQRFQNPLRQNYAHVKATRELLGLRPNQVHNVVVFVGDCTLKTPMPPEVVHGVFALAKFIKSRRFPVITEHELPAIVDDLLDYRLHPGWRTDVTHVRNVKKQIDAGACPRCGGMMVERANKRSGDRFLGCNRYPDCKGTRSLP